MDSYVSPIEHCEDRCPGLIQEAVELISPKWAMPIFVALRVASGPLRYAQLQRRVTGITPKELARHLHRFENAELVARTVYPTVPPAVEYELTDKGKALMPALEQLADWTIQQKGTGRRKGSG